VSPIAQIEEAIGVNLPSKTKRSMPKSNRDFLCNWAMAVARTKISCLPYSFSLFIGNYGNWETGENLPPLLAFLIL
jgi:hypothetical protein